MVRSTGRWDQPRFWRRPDYLELSPWSSKELTEVFQVLRIVYPADEVRRIFANSDGFPWLASLLLDPWRPDLSGLLALGFDALHAGVKRFPDLYRKLRDAKEYPGARLELAIIAALARTGLTYEYEPFALESKRCARLGKRFSNPDLRLNMGLSIIADVKKMLPSARAHRRQQRLMLLLNGPTEDLAPLSAAFEMTRRYVRIEQSDYSEDRLDRLAQRLRTRALQAIEDMRARGLTTSTIGGGLLKLDTSHRHSLGLPREHPRDAGRINAKLDEGASQVPAGEKGIIIVEPSDSDDLSVVAATARAWLELAKPDVVGVVLLAERWLVDSPGKLRVPYPVWRSTAPAKLRKSEHWHQLAIGLNWQWIRVRTRWKQRRP